MDRGAEYHDISQEKFFPYCVHIIPDGALRHRACGFAVSAGKTVRTKLDFVIHQMNLINAYILRVGFCTFDRFINQKIGRFTLSRTSYDCQKIHLTAPFDTSCFLRLPTFFIKGPTPTVSTCRESHLPEVWLDGPCTTLPTSRYI
jgi:hypothetical protein